jgi:pilus assembly protein Flp/PilA
MSKFAIASIASAKIVNATVITSAQRFARDEGGATAIEYAMIASGVAVAVAAAITGLGTKVNGLFVTVSTSLK